MPFALSRDSGPTPSVGHVTGDMKRRESNETPSGASALDDKTATVQYKPATSLAGNKNALAHYEQSRGYNQISHALSNIRFMACTGGAVISLTSYPYTVCTRVSCQAVSPTNGLGTRLLYLRK